MARISPTPTASPTRRRWFQFGIGTILLLAALVSVSAFAAREHWERRRLGDENASLGRALEDAQREAAKWSDEYGQLLLKYSTLGLEDATKTEALVDKAIKHMQSLGDKLNEQKAEQEIAPD